MVLDNTYETNTTNHDKSIVHHRSHPGNMLGYRLFRIFSRRNYPRIIGNRYHSINPWRYSQGITSILKLKAWLVILTRLFHY
jgi:hypothetical protein